VEKIKKWVDNRHEYAKQWKEKTGGKVLGCFCSYVPEEILYAANILPVRMLGSHEPQDLTEPHIFSMFCPFCRDVLAQGLKKRFDYLDGITIGQSCLHLRQAFTSWDLHIPVEYSYYIPMPHHVQSQRAYPFLTEELKLFKEAVEKWTGKTITNEDLDRGIEILNTTRHLLLEIYELRKLDNPPITGEETMSLVLASQFIDKREFNEYVKGLLSRLNERKLDRITGERLMILGSENDDRIFMDMVESLSATFVIEDHCTGSRYFWNLVEPGEDRLAAIAARYIDRPACPTKDWPERKRLPRLLKMAKDWNVKGIIVMQQKFCDPHELDIVAIQKYFKEHNIPTLFLEFDITAPIGQLRIQIEAFLEMIRQEDLF